MSIPEPTPELHAIIAEDRAKAGLRMKYFVLKPAGDDAYAKASRAAMFRYARFIREDNPTLSRELTDWAAQENAEAHARGAYDADELDDVRDKDTRA